MPCLVADGNGNLKGLGIGRYTYFQQFEPAAMAGYSIYIYYLTLEDANRLRRELGRPELTEEAMAKRS